MRIARFATRSLNDVASLRPYRPLISRSLATNANQDHTQFESWLSDGNTGNDEKGNSFYKHLGNAERDRRDYRSQGPGSRYSGTGSMNRGERFDPSSDGVDGKLKDAAMFNIMDEDEGVKDDFSSFSSFSSRPGVRSFGGNNFPMDLTFKNQRQRPRQNITKPEITTKEVLEKADFRNVRFLEQFITEAGIIIQRKQTGISAKAQRRVAREIKTARAFGLMPFTTMGTKAFMFGKSMENKDQDFEYEAHDDDDDEYDNAL